jgi:hypothetical protein
VTAAIVLYNAMRGNVCDVDVQRVLRTILGVLMVAAAEALFGRHTQRNDWIFRRPDLAI